MNQAPAITSTNTTTFTVGAAGTFTVTATGFPAPSISETGALPGGVTYNSSTHVLSGTPAVGTGGVYAVTFSASNVAGTQNQSFTLTVNEAPSITSANNVTFQTGVAGTFTVTTTGFPAPSIARGGVVLPSGVSFINNGNGTGTLSGTPGAASGGTYAITFTATNIVGSTPAQNFTLTVNQAPAVTSANAGTFTVIASGFPAPSINQTGTLPTGVSYNASTHVLSGTPAATTGGVYNITFTASNGVTPNAVQNFTLTVNEAPSFTSVNSVNFVINTASTFTVTTLGFPKPSIGESGALPAGMTFIDNSNGTATLSGTPTAAGTFPLGLTATNSVSTANQTLTVRVWAPPVAVADAFQAGLNTPRVVGSWLMARISTMLGCCKVMPTLPSRLNRSMRCLSSLQRRRRTLMATMRPVRGSSAR